MRNLQQIEKENQLLVEGNDQKNFFEGLAKDLSLDIQVQDFGGVKELRGELGAFVKSPHFHIVKSVGIVRDAEADALAAFQSVRSSLEQAHLSVPTTAGQRYDGDGSPTVSVLILPDNKSPGMLETLLCQTLTPDMKDCIHAFFECTKISIKNKDKACAFAYLATRSKPRHSVGGAAKSGDWDLNHEAFKDVRAFLEGLYRPTL